MAFARSSWIQKAFALSIGLSCTGLTAQLSAQSLSMAEAEQRLRLSYQLLAQQADVEAWQFQAEALDSLAMPQLDITIAGIAYHKDVFLHVPTIQDPVELDFFRSGIRSQVNVLWPLYTGGRTAAAQQQVAARVTQAEAEQQQLQQQLVKRLLDLYFSSQMMQQVVQVRQQAQQALLQHVHRAKRFEEEGVITSLQRMQAEVAKADARREAVQAKQQWLDIQAALSNLLQLEPVGCLTTPLPTPVELTQPAQWFVGQARRSNPVFHQLSAKQQQATQQLKLEQGKLMPEVFLVGSYDLNRSATPLTEPDWSVGLGVRYHLLTNTNRRSAINSVQSRQQQLHHATAQAQADIELAVQAQYRQVKNTNEQFQLLQQDLTLAREHARLQSRAFEQGMATSLDVTDARLKLAAAEVTLLQVAYQHISALAQLSQLTGQPELLTQLMPAVLQSQPCPEN
ncbi:MAG: TolC family protein [Alkalimonas sp.]|nr:TolC family protein [Alkalimonas sp.]